VKRSWFHNTGFINLKTAIVTGASKGVGYATVKLLSENGYRVIAVSRDLSRVNELRSDLVETYRLDITNEQEIKEYLKHDCLSLCEIMTRFRQTLLQDEKV
jgi:short-subunit dehydrogenase